MNTNEINGLADVIIGAVEALNTTKTGVKEHDKMESESDLIEQYLSEYCTFYEIERDWITDDIMVNVLRTLIKHHHLWKTDGTFRQLFMCTLSDAFAYHNLPPDVRDRLKEEGIIW